jgi:hypothetical protein
MFRTELQLEPSPFKIHLSDTLLTVGSCFSDAVGNKLSQHKFRISINPFGTNYNPVSIHKSLHYALSNQQPQCNGFVESQGVLHHYDFHSSFSALQRTDIETKIISTISAEHEQLKKVKWLIITYGTAWVYERVDTGEIVANCHKVPDRQFRKSLLQEQQILESFDGVYKALKSFNASCNIILTVSPVRHIKDTLPLNTVSKSVLRVACQRLTEKYPDVHYFPSFEIMMDDLRDYRFYKADMIHPSEEAEEYIWAKFAESFFDEETKRFIRHWKRIQSSLAHKAFHPQTKQHQQFLRTILSELKELRGRVNVEAEIQQVESQLIY